MRDFNNVVMTGRLGNDPKVISGDNASTKVVVLNMAHNYSEKVDGEWQEKTHWVGVKCFGKQAEFCEKYLQKGTQVLVGGSIGLRTYEKDGEPRTTLDLKADTVQMFSKPKDAKDAPADSGVAPF